MRNLKISMMMLATGALLVACGGGDDSADALEKQMEQQAARAGIDADVKVDNDGDVESIEINRGGSTVGQNIGLPADFPIDIELPSDWNIIAVTPVPGLDGHSLQALSSDDGETIISEVRQSMTENGWTEIPGDASPLARAGFEKDGRIANFAVTPNGATNAVQFTTMKKPG
ncbi:MAG: hypothetical protein AAGC77_03290 [Pseudomonadota bacterium]